MKFVDEYKYKNIPFCNSCWKHTEFSVNTTNSIRGAVSLDNPNGPDPTFVANKSTTNIHCNTCGKIMSRFEDINRSFEDATDYEMQFYSDSELICKKGSFEWLVGWAMALAPIGCTYLVGQESDNADWMIFLFFLSLFWLISAILSLYNDPKEHKCNAEKAKRKSRRSERLRIGTSPNNEKVVFNQKTGVITYE
jgi:hypothetical protein